MRLIDADELPISSIDITDVGYYISKYGQGIPAVYLEDIKDAPTIEPEYSMDEWCKDCKEYDQERHCCPRFNRIIRSAIDDAQPERIRGKWLPDNNNYYEERHICSACGRSYKVDVCMGEPMWDFCPNCGADMRESR